MTTEIEDMEILKTDTIELEDQAKIAWRKIVILAYKKLKELNGKVIHKQMLSYEGDNPLLKIINHPGFQKALDEYKPISRLVNENGEHLSLGQIMVDEVYPLDTWSSNLEPFSQFDFLAMALHEPLDNKNTFNTLQFFNVFYNDPRNVHYEYRLEVNTMNHPEQFSVNFKLKPEFSFGNSIKNQLSVSEDSGIEWLSYISSVLTEMLSFVDVFQESLSQLQPLYLWASENIEGFYPR